MSAKTNKNTAKSAKADKTTTKSAKADKSTAKSAKVTKTTAKSAKADKSTTKSAKADKSTAKNAKITKTTAKTTAKTTTKSAKVDKSNLPKAMDLFQAYQEGKMPDDGGYIVTSYFNENSTYSIYEVIAYDNVKSIHSGETSLTFQADGHKIYVLVEPMNYAHKYLEPFTRSKEESIPQRFNELDIVVAKNQTKVMVSKNPVISYSSFTVLKPTGVNFAIIFYHLDDVLKSLEFFFTQTLNKEAGVPQSDTKKSARTVIEGLKRFKLWQ